MLLHKKYPYSTGAVCLGIVGYAVTSLTDLEVFEHIVTISAQLEEFEFDEILIAGVLLLVGVLIDTVKLNHRKTHEAEIRDNRLRAMQATMRTVHDIVNNNLNKLICYVEEAHESTPLDSEIKSSIDDCIHETAEKLRELGKTKNLVEKDLGFGRFAIDMQPRPAEKESLN